MQHLIICINSLSTGIRMTMPKPGLGNSETFPSEIHNTHPALQLIQSVDWAAEVFKMHCMHNLARFVWNTCSTAYNNTMSGSIAMMDLHG